MGSQFSTNGISPQSWTFLQHNRIHRGFASKKSVPPKILSSIVIFFLCIRFLQSLFWMYVVPTLFVFFVSAESFVCSFDRRQRSPDSQTQWSVQSWRLSKLFSKQNKHIFLKQVSAQYLRNPTLYSICQTWSIVFVQTS